MSVAIHNAKRNKPYPHLGRPKGLAERERIKATRALTIQRKQTLGISARQYNNVDILQEKDAWERQGYRCFPIGLYGDGYPVPDLIAVKDGKIIAIEVERPQIRKATKAKYVGKTAFDKVFFVVKNKWGDKRTEELAKT